MPGIDPGTALRPSRHADARRMSKEEMGLLLDLIAAFLRPERGVVFHGEAVA